MIGWGRGVARAVRRGAMGGAPSFVAVVAVLGFLLVTVASSIETARRAGEPRRAQLVQLIESRQRQVAALDEEVHALRARVAAVRLAVSRLSASDRERAAAGSTLAMQAGTAAVTGRALTVRVQDSAHLPADAEDANAYRIHDTDLQLVVNALFAAGAEAVAVNDNRVVATTPIRGAGDTIVVNFRPLTPPYTVVAIGADRQAFERSEIARRFSQWHRLFGLGWSVRSVPRVTIPGFTGRLTPAHATPVSRGAAR